MLPERVSNPGPLTYESGALPIELRSPAPKLYAKLCHLRSNTEIQLSTQCRACSKINISKSKNSNFVLSTK